MQGERDLQAPRFRQELVDPEQRPDSRRGISDVGWVLAQLAKILVPAGERQVHLRHVGGRQPDVERRRDASIVDHPDQADVVHPQLRLTDQDRLLRAEQADRHFRHGREARRRGCRITDVNHVGAVATDVRRAVPAAGGRPRRRITAKPRRFHLASQCEPSLEIHDDLRFPGVGPGRCAIEIEVVLVAAHLDVEIQIALVPPRPTTPRPHPELAVVEEVAVGFAREPDERFRPLADGDFRREEAKRLLVDLHRPHAEADVGTRRQVGHAGRWDVAEIGILRRDDRGGDLPTRHTHASRQPGDRGGGPLDPRCADQPHPGQGKPDRALGSGHPLIRRHHRDPHRLDLAQVRLPLHRRLIPEGNPVQPPRARAPGVVHVAHTIADEERVIPDGEHVPCKLLGRPAHIAVEPVVTVEVLGVQEAIPAGATRVQIPQWKCREAAQAAKIAARHPFEHRAGQLVDEAVRSVAQDAEIVQARIEHVGEGVLFRVQPIGAHEPEPAERGIRAGSAERLGSEGDGVFEHRAEIEHEIGVLCLRRAVPVLQHPEFHEFHPRQIDAQARPATQRLRDAAPPGTRRARPHPSRPPGERIGVPAHRIRLEGQPEHGFDVEPRPHECNGRVDVPWSELHHAGPALHQVLPDQRDRVVERELAQWPQVGRRQPDA